MDEGDQARLLRGLRGDLFARGLPMVRRGSCRPRSYLGASPLTPTKPGDEVEQAVEECCAKLADLGYYVRADSDQYIETLAATVERVTVEKAAKAAEDTDTVEARETYYAQLGDAGATRRAIAASIRSLLPAQEDK